MVKQTELHKNFRFILLRYHETSRSRCGVVTKQGWLSQRRLKSVDKVERGH